MATILIATTTLFFSLFGLGLMCSRKISALVEMPSKKGRRKNNNLFLIFRKKISENDFLKNFSYEFFLQKILSKIRILTLKTDSKTSHLLQILRQKSKIKKDLENDNYWEEIKKSKEKD
ncbi:MAG: hypothetical protein ABH967_01820 [Patescibacteria group bacterium]